MKKVKKKCIQSIKELNEVKNISVNLNTKHYLDDGIYKIEKKIKNNEHKNLTFDYYQNKYKSKDWLHEYCPKSSKEICINPLKLYQIRTILYNMINKVTEIRLLILTGPSGSSKSTTIKILSNELINEYQIKNNIKTNNLNLNFNLKNTNKWDEFLSFSQSPDSNIVTCFDNFLDNTKFKIKSNLSVILIEDLPNIYHKETLKNFRNSIMKWLSISQNNSNFDSVLPPLVLCLTEFDFDSTNLDINLFSNIENHLNVENLLGIEILNSKFVTVIKVNPIAKKFLTKTLDFIIKSESKTFENIPKKDITNIINDLAKIGDIRSAIVNFQVWAKCFNCKKKENKIPTLNSDKIKEVKPKLIEKINLINLCFIRECRLKLFHIVGKIIFSSSEFSDFNDNRISDFFCIEKILSNYNHNNLLLINLSVLENYHIFQNGNFSLKIANEIANDLSLCDIFNNLNNYKEIGIRSARCNLRSVKSLNSAKNFGSSSNKFEKTTFPIYFKSMKQKKIVHFKVISIQKYIFNLKISFNNLNLIDGFFLPIIYNKKLKKENNYKRIGGNFLFSDFNKDNYKKKHDDSNQSVVDQFQTDIKNILKTRLFNEINNSDENDDIESDPIENSDDNSKDSVFNDKNNSILPNNKSFRAYNDYVQLNNPIKEHVEKKKKNDKTFVDENSSFLSDYELNELIQQGKI